MLPLQDVKRLGMSKAILEILKYYFDNNRDTTSYARSFVENLYITILGIDGSDTAMTVNVLFKESNWDNQLDEVGIILMQDIIDCLYNNYDLIQNITIMCYSKD